MEDDEIRQQRRIVEYLRLTGLDTHAATKYLNELLARRAAGNRSVAAFAGAEER